MKSMEKYTSVITEAPDGSGDCIVEIPQEMLDKLGWNENTVLDWRVENDTIYLSVANTQHSVASDE